MNITHPLKQAVLAYLTDLSDDARALGAVNTVVLRDGRRTGHNTDWSGFYQNFESGLPGVERRHALLLGAGGAGVAVAHAALILGIRHLSISDVDPTRSARLAHERNERFGLGRAVATDNVALAMGDADGLIHATPTGMASYPGLPLDETLLEPRHWVADIVYMPLVTALLALARQKGCRTLDGAGMVAYQAAGAFGLFTDIEADPARMRAHFSEMTETQAKNDVRSA